MASGPIVGDDGAREKQRYTESKVYTRKAFKGPKNKANALNATSPATVTAKNDDNNAATATAPDTVTAKNDGNNAATAAATATATASTTADNAIENSTVENGSADEARDNRNNSSALVPGQDTLPEDGSLPKPQVISRLGVASDALSSLNCRQDEPLSINLEQDGSLAQPQVNSMLGVASDDLSSLNRGQDEPLRMNLEPDGSLAQPQVNSRLGVASDDLSSLNHRQDEPLSINLEQDDGPGTQDTPGTQVPPLENGAAKVVLENRVKISLVSQSKKEMRELRRKLESDLNMVRSLVNKIEEKQGLIGGNGNSNVLVDHGIHNGSGVKRAHSEVASAGVPREPTRPLNQLSVSVLENSQGVSEIVEKEKRTPKANQFYHNSEFLLAKDKFPPSESKKSKLNGKKHGGGEMGHGLGMRSKYFKSCSSLLEKLMKHKYAWVFNTPVDVEGLGLHDYFSIIAHPMDLGTVKSRLNKNWYKSPKEFAEDVRLTFRNAMTYNPKGQDVYIMAEELLKLFEDRWAIIESNYNREMRYGIDYGAVVPSPSPLSRKAPPFRPPPLDMRRILDRSESMTHPPRPMSITPSVRTPAPKKPKAKDPHKRDMTYEEKQKLSTNLQSLPSEKLDAIVQIIKKRNSALPQHDDEIEVDIDSVDAETLWELDRFVTNYKKSLSKNKRKAELAMQARAQAELNAHRKSQAPIMVEVPTETQADERNVPPSLPVQGEIQADNGSKSSSSSSSSSDSDSSSSDSDSDSSSASGSDTGSQRT